jgi:hypothetical protein
MSRAFEGSYLGDGSKIADDTRLGGICWWVNDPARRRATQVVVARVLVNARH